VDAEWTFYPLAAHEELSARTRSFLGNLLTRADAGTRTPDPFITSEVLYQLSYVGLMPMSQSNGGSRGALERTARVRALPPLV
jgi:hypothetical protein